MTESVRRKKNGARGRRERDRLKTAMTIAAEADKLRHGNAWVAGDGTPGRDGGGTIETPLGVGTNEQMAVARAIGARSVWRLAQNLGASDKTIIVMEVEGPTAAAVVEGMAEAVAAKPTNMTLARAARIGVGLELPTEIGTTRIQAARPAPELGTGILDNGRIRSRRADEKAGETPEFVAGLGIAAERRDLPRISYILSTAVTAKRAAIRAAWIAANHMDEIVADFGDAAERMTIRVMPIRAADARRIRRQAEDAGDGPAGMTGFGENPDAERISSMNAGLGDWTFDETEYDIDPASIADAECGTVITEAASGRYIVL